MMDNIKLLLVAVNAKYVHTNIAVRYISRYNKSKNKNCEFCEFTINEPYSSVLAKLFEADCDVYGFSCYIWNIEYVLKLCQSLKRLRPERKILLGGPEVSFDSQQLLEKNPFVDYIICGEGELAVESFLTNPPQNRCVIYGEKLSSLEDLPFPYSDEDLEVVVKGEKLVYYEASRGCPFSCSYCLSSVDLGVRVLPIERVKREISLLVQNKVQTIKFVDRTFNADKKRAAEIWKYCKELEGETQFHFEIGADLLDDELIDLLSENGAEKFQFEIGVQTVNEKSLLAVSRKMDIAKLFKNVIKMRSETDVKLHLDLIAGLPYEDFSSFQETFNKVYSLNPHVLQLGFLKLLKGSRLRGEASKYGICFCDFAPYEVFYTDCLSFAEITKLKAIEDVLERYFNSGRFCDTLKVALRYFKSPFDFYNQLSEYWTFFGLVGQGVKRISLYSHLYDFLKDKLSSEDLRDVVLELKKDFSHWHSNGVGTPEWYRKY